MDSDPPPVVNVPDRSTVATEPRSARSSSRVPVGMVVVNPPAVAAASGPASSASTAARATAPPTGVTVTPSTPIFSPRTRYTSTVVGVPGAVADGEDDDPLAEGADPVADGDPPPPLEPQAATRATTKMASATRILRIPPLSRARGPRGRADRPRPGRS